MFNQVRSILLISVASIQCASTTRPRSVSAVSSAQSRCSFIRRRRYTVKWLSRLRHLQVQTPTLAEGAQCASDMNACHPSYGPAKEQTKNCQIGRRLNRIAKRQMVRDHWVSTRVSFMRRSSTRTLLVAPFPGIETPDYHEVSLREKQPGLSGPGLSASVAILSISRIVSVVRIVSTTPSLPFRVSKTQRSGAKHSNVSFRTHSFSQTVRAVTGCDLGFRETCGFVVH